MESAINLALGMARYFSENWCYAAAVIFLSGMVIFGHHMGFVRQILPVLSWLSGLCVSRLLTPVVGSMLEKSGILSGISDRLAERILEDCGMSAGVEATAEAQKNLINSLPVPWQAKELLLKNNTLETYARMGVETFAEYVADSLANMFLSFLCAAAIFIAIYILVRMTSHFIERFFHLPGLWSLNQIAGAVLGFIRGMLCLCFVMFILRLLSGEEWANAFIPQLEKNSWLGFLYEHNIFDALLSGAMQHFG